jgi:hypothetical protein
MRSKTVFGPLAAALRRLTPEVIPGACRDSVQMDDIIPRLAISLSPGWTSRNAATVPEAWKAGYGRKRLSLDIQNSILTRISSNQDGRSARSACHPLGWRTPLIQTSRSCPRSEFVVRASGAQSPHEKRRVQCSLCLPRTARPCRTADDPLRRFHLSD